MIQPGFPAERLLVVEVLTPAGSWSSYPPHKHDEDRPPDEVVLEEVYYYRAPRPRRSASSGSTRRRASSTRRGRCATATSCSSRTATTRSRAAPGYDFYYLNALAGDHHSMAYSDDPALAWIRDTWAETPKVPTPRVPLVTA